ncbi:MAG: two component transcriptional regulator, winged helix family [Patescibacteria group bacterium]|jgi:DNA-binding response OmpR family regulator|nr:two component transcriptional regulator, winged helix family [Patescibacteria group bacterium]
MRLLIVEDDALVAETLNDLLSEEYEVEVIDSGKEALSRASKNDYDLILLDIGLPDMDGEAVCSELRNRKITVPVIMVTGKQEVDYKVRTLDKGADDYITKPFSFPELNARIRAVLRRSKGAPIPAILRCGDLVLDTNARTVTRQGKDIELRRKEFDILEYLVINRGRIVTRSMIIDHIWDENTNAFSNVVDVHIKYLRDRIEKPFKSQIIKTVHGLGYTISA